jgi:hypothetical protein
MGHFAYYILNNPYTLGALCYALVVVPILGIWYIHRK